MSTLLLEVILAAIMGPETVRFEVSTLDALRVPPMKASLVTVFRLVIVRLEDSIFDTEMVSGSLALSRVPEVTLDAFRSDKASPEPMKSVAFTLPMTSNLCVGCAVPMPTFEPSTTTALFADHSVPSHARISPIWVPFAGPAFP